MNQEDAKAVLADVHATILKQIQEQPEKVDESLLIDFLHDLANALISSDFKAPLSNYAHYLSFEDEYRTIARTSIESYVDSNRAIERISEEQQTILDQVSTTEELTRRFTSIQEHLSKEVERARQTITQLTERVKELENKASIDPLTKIYNRRAMDHYLGEMIKKDNEIPLHILLIDVDDFKKVNDSYGHIAGDKVLMVLANGMKSTLRDSDKIFRYGGEEFLITLNRISEDGSKIVGERILSLARHNKLLYKKHQFSVTLSIGATVLRPGDTVETLINRADEALYRAKNDGKDRMEVEL